MYCTSSSSLIPTPPILVGNILLSFDCRCFVVAWLTHWVTDRTNNTLRWFPRPAEERDQTGGLLQQLSESCSGTRAICCILRRFSWSMPSYCGRHLNRLQLKTPASRLLSQELVIITYFPENKKQAWRVKASLSSIMIKSAVVRI